MQEKNVPRKGFLDRMTDGAIKRSSRRGLLGNLGKKGLVFASATGLAAVGLGVDTRVAGAAPQIVAHTSVSSNQHFEADAQNPDCVIHPGPCEGSCIFCAGETSTCTTGGARCTIHITGCLCCLQRGVRAQGSFDCFGHFHCVTLQC